LNVVGDPRYWLPSFPKGFIPDILSGIRASWDRMTKPSRTEIETRITKKLKHELRQDPTLKDLPLRIAREYTLDDPDTGQELGRIDLCWFHGYHDQTYMAFECKRLNVSFPSGKRSLAADYTGEKGMGCFLSGKYSAGHEHGGMVGYVMEGDLSAAIDAVSTAVLSARGRLFMPVDASLSKSSLHPDDPQMRETGHLLEDVKLTLHHVFLPI
jgi:hypothetical protein